jgi:uncharacterized protein (UPF0261 family)
LLEASGLEVIVVDFGVVGEPSFAPHIESREVAAAGGGDLEQLRAAKDKTDAMRVMQSGLARTVERLFAEGRIGGILAMGGTGGSAIAAAAMRSLPLGVPKVLVSTVGTGDMSSYVGSRDIVVIPSVVDVAGINRISRLVYANAAAALAGMVLAPKTASTEDRPLLCASMFGNTTQCVERARATLEKRGYEVLVFHATGSGGRTMQSLVEDGYIAGVFDITTTELADQVCGGVFSAGADRVRLGASQRVPVILAPGCVDMCNFGARGTVPERYADRLLYEWNPNVTLLRTNVEENIRIGTMLAETANLCAGPVKVLFPTKGVSMLDSLGNPFWDPQADRACLEAVRRGLRAEIPLIQLDCNVNDPEFADRAAQELLSMLDETSLRSNR